VSEPNVRPATEEDLDAILDLVRSTLGEGSVPRTRAYWEWKHLANPFGRSYLLVAEAGAAIVGLRAFMRWTWWSAGQPVPAVRAVDTVTHPDWRGRGVFKRLTLELVDRVRSEGVAFVFNTPNNRSRPGYLKMGWVPVGRLTPWVRPLVLRRWLAQPALPGENRLACAGELLDMPGLDPLLHSPETPDARLGTRCDRGFLRWRYAESPGMRYRAIWALGNNRGAALVLRVLERPHLKELRLCEILVAPDRESTRCAGALIAEAARRAGADYVTALAPAGTSERRVVRLAGFVPIPRTGPILTVRQLNPAPVDPRLRRSWRPSVGAMELF